MPKPPRGSLTSTTPPTLGDTKGVPISAVSTVTIPASTSPVTSDSVAPTSVSTTVQVTLAKYVVHEEDDGVGGSGVDLYMGFLASGVEAESGSTPASGGMTKNNGGEPRNVHDVTQSLFALQLASGEGTCGVARLHLIESDETTLQVKQAFAAAQIPRFGDIPPAQLTGADVPLLYLGPIGAIIKLLGGANTDDDYGHWNLTFSRRNGAIHCQIQGGDSHCHATPSSLEISDHGVASLSLSYIDDDNDIECVLELRRPLDEAAYLQEVMREEQEANKRG
jgi:hypothetical protein